MRNRQAARTTFVVIFTLLVLSVAYAMYAGPQRGIDVVQVPVRDAPEEIRASPGSARAAAASLPKMIELYADWCPPCQRMKPILDQLEKEYKGKVQFVRIDVDKDQAAAKKYKVTSIPVQLFYDKNGKNVLRHEGFYSKEQIKAQFTKMGIKPAK